MERASPDKREVRDCCLSDLVFFYLIEAQASQSHDLRTFVLT